MDFNVEKFAKLARIRLGVGEPEKIGNDLQKILGHFEELQSVKTNRVDPMAGGTPLFNIFREDTEDNSLAGGAEGFPEEKEGYLKSPKIRE